ncbi:hypothetical protein Pcinc_019429 [Petrolisthes cinctipes]|uniref:Uncharacterized protein n=1 Tax=Petrolisthes cinctipes TaxID=88211 RepID=A0AAE1FPY4_PETCI|nr:hypothetical protein Pcinc_019429 [Petrolisthes cinctipes]
MSSITVHLLRCNHSIPIPSPFFSYSITHHSSFPPPLNQALQLSSFPSSTTKATSSVLLLFYLHAFLLHHASFFPTSSSSSLPISPTNHQYLFKVLCSLRKLIWVGVVMSFGSGVGRPSRRPRLTPPSHVKYYQSQTFGRQVAYEPTNWERDEVGGRWRSQFPVADSRGSVGSFSHVIKAAVLFGPSNYLHAGGTSTLRPRPNNSK